ncbi:uncharacterized protein DS421_19g659470 [Arachis hypogaea]|uniref:Uncharacterized protein n=1 Tax=Arachis hypogaea TaxID=3818 RepID=A0A6B9VAI1_ARAHY|nr:uncharacterized protein DS421_19g659470 [Arachis hypogaea]
MSVNGQSRWGYWMWAGSQSVGTTRCWLGLPDVIRWWPRLLAIVEEGGGVDRADNSRLVSASNKGYQTSTNKGKRGIVC